LDYRQLDRQLGAFSGGLRTAVGLTGDEAEKVATTVAAEVRFLEPSQRAAVFAASPVPLHNRLEELTAFQAFMDTASRIRGDPALTRAQAIVQNYVCFVYLSEACFRALLKNSKASSVTRRCCKFLTDNPIRAFRNAIAHSNCSYAPDFAGLVFWARKGSDANEPLSRFEVSQNDLDFWQALSRGVAYAAYTSIETAGPKHRAVRRDGGTLG
jgi:hypothetical protein